MLFLLAKRILSVSLLCLIFSTALNAKIYKHVDKDGKVTYSDKPIDEKSVEITTPKETNQSNKKQAQERAQKLINSKNILMDRLKDEKETKLKKQRKKDKLDKTCQAAKKQLELLNMQVRLVEVEKGVKTNKYVSDEERAKEKSKLEKFVSENCQN